MNRRAFLRALGFGTVAAAAAATGVLDIERLLWQPGERSIFIPEPTFEWLTKGDVFTIPGIHAINPMTGRQVEWLKRFVVIEDARACDPIVNIYPPIIAVGPYRNVSSPSLHLASDEQASHILRAIDRRRVPIDPAFSGSYQVEPQVDLARLSQAYATAVESQQAYVRG